MNSEQQYIELYEQTRGMIFQHSSEVMNAMRDAAFEQFRSLGFPSRKVERYKYTDMQALFAPDYGLNLNRLEIPVNPYDAFRCDVPNLSTMLYFVVNDAFYSKVLPKGNIPVGVVIGSLKEFATSQYYHRLASKDEDAVTSLNTMLAQDGLYVYVPKPSSTYIVWRRPMPRTYGSVMYILTSRQTAVSTTTSLRCIME